jgi:DNA-binding CsgD family transcriptional regulator
LETPTKLAVLWFSPRERTVGALLCRRQSNKQIGYELGISTATARDHVSRLIAKLRDRGVDVANRLDVAEWLHQHRDAIESGYTHDTDANPMALHDDDCDCDSCSTRPRLAPAA